MKVLITGSSGQLGTEAALACTRAGDEVIALGRNRLDITDSAAVRSVVTAHAPDIVINCAAWTAVDDCESNPARAMAVNGTGARILAEATAEFGAHLVHLSTDYVFSGDLTRPYTEVDATGPINVYGSAKLAGELAVLAILPTATIVRTSWVSGYHGANIVKTTLHLADRAENLLFVDDQWGSPTFAEDLAPLLRQLGVDRVTGIVHATNQGEVTWFGLAREILSAAGLDPKRVQPVSSDTLAPQRPARRPANSRLENARLRSLGIPPLPPFEESLAVLVRRLRES